MPDISSLTVDGILYNLKDAVARQDIAAIEGDIQEVQADIQSLIAAVGTPLVASTAAQMVDTSKIYVYTGSETGYTAGNWYYWDGSDWVSGGVYNSTAFTTDTTLTVAGAAADAKATGDKITEFNCDGLFRNGFYNTAGTYIGSFTSNDSYRCCIMHVLPGEKLKISGIGATNGRLWAFAKADKEITRRADAGGYLDDGVMTVAANESYFIYNAAASSNIHPLSLAIEIDKEKALETLRTTDENFEARIVNIETRQLNAMHINNNLISDGIGNLLGVQCYNNGVASASNYGVDGTKYEIDIGDFDKAHVFFRYRHNSYADYSGIDITVPIASFGKNNALNVQELYREVTVSKGTLYKKSYIYPANNTASNSELLNPIFYKMLNGPSALRIFYTGTVTNTTMVSVDFANGSMTFNVGGSTVGTITLVGTDTVQDLADDINAITGFSCTVDNSNGTVADLLLPGELSINMIDSVTREGATVYGATYIAIPYKIDDAWHTCEIVVDKTSQLGYVAYDGLTKKVTFRTNTPLTDGVIVIGGNYSGYGNITVRDLELDINSLGDCEIVAGKNNNASTSDTHQLISKHNPRLMIFEGHGILVSSEAEAQEAYQESGSSTSQEAMQASTDRLNIVFGTLAKRGYTCVTLKQIVEWKKGLIDLPKRCYACVFDDNRLVNYLDYDKRNPFVKYGVKAGLAQISDLLQPTDEISVNGTTYTVQNAIDMINIADWYVCSHTSDHRKLSDYTVSENIEKLKADVLSCNTHRIHSDVMVYPYGGINAASICAMSASDFAIGVSVVEDRYNCRMLTDYRLVRTELGTRAALADVLAPFI